VCQTQTVEVQTGQEVTLPCKNISNTPTSTFFFRLVNGTKTSCISSMYAFNGKASFCPEFENGKFEMRSNVSTVFLTIKKVDLSDSGLYFCGFYINGQVLTNVIHLNVQEDPEGTHMTFWIMFGVTVAFFLVIIGLLVQMRKLHGGTISEMSVLICFGFLKDHTMFACLSLIYSIFIHVMLLKSFPKR
ncbi:hypothetical protein LDENG_00000480, partial [Lucifuga dentata]